MTTLAIEPRPRAPRLLLWTELLALFVGVPLVVYLLPVPKIPTLLIIGLGCSLVLGSDAGWDRTELALTRLRGALSFPFVRFGVLAPALVAVALLIVPESLFALPRERPWMFVTLLVFYPLLSALPQELIYRLFFFRRYRPLFGEGIALELASAALFGLLHLIYDNGVAVALSACGGFLFARTFRHTRSLWAVSLEHAVYGLAIFAIGLGAYFYEPVAP
jgi:hypothetical protein